MKESAQIYDVCVVGAGAAGMVAAIAAARAGVSVCLIERGQRLGRKVAITGGGRCNIMNAVCDASAYHPMHAAFFDTVFARFGKAEMRTFFDDLGLPTVTEEDGRVFPRCGQAASVVRVLEDELRRLGVRIYAQREITDLRRERGVMACVSAQGNIQARRVIVAAGGKSYPALGSNGSGYALAQDLGHTTVMPVPSGVPLVVSDRMVHMLQGQRVDALLVGCVNGVEVIRARGDLLFANYGLSGTAAIDVSEPLSVAWERDGCGDVSVIIDLLPDMSEAALAAEFSRRVVRGFSAQQMTAGLLPNKFDALFEKMFQTVSSAEAAAELKHIELAVNGTRGWNEAEFTSGGIPLDEVDAHTMRSRKADGVFFAGEMLDIKAKRGGHHLAFCWASGYLAGVSAARG